MMEDLKMEDFENGYEYLKKLRKEKNCRKDELIAMSYNTDPFYIGSAADKKLARWFADLYKENDFPKGIHLRKIHYKLISVETYKVNEKRYLNVERDWNELGKASRYARYLGYVNPDDFDDRRNPEVIEYFPYDEMFHRHSKLSIKCEMDSDCNWNIPTIYTNLTGELDSWNLNNFSVRNYNYSDIFQKYHLEIWCEKTTMHDVLDNICKTYHINLVEGMGFMSITMIRDAIKRFKRVRHPVVILYISDFDPQGHAMPNQVARQLQFWILKDKCDTEIKLKQIVLTKEQVEEYNLPRLPIKETNVCAGNFEDVFGSGAVELDALEGIYQGEFRKIVEAEIKKYYDTNLRHKFSNVYSLAIQEAHRLDKEIEEKFEDRLNELREEAESVIEDYESKLEEIESDYTQEMETIEENLQDLWNDVRRKVNNTVPEVPKRPEPELDEIDEEKENYLFDSKRDYLEQMEIYKKYKAGGITNLN